MATENKDLMRAMQDLRRSSATQRHVPKARKGTRAAHKRAAMRESA
jgi:hypothetical protein